VNVNEALVERKLASIYYDSAADGYGALGTHLVECFSKQFKNFRAIAEH
jgi:hypothetical protein